jgi:hypothetical protein
VDRSPSAADTSGENILRITAPAQGRSRGQCSLCCKLSFIEAPLNKPAGIWCQHCRPGKGGCSIYDERPEPCRDFLCLWLAFSYFDDRWKPTTAKFYVFTESGGNRLAVHVDPAFPNKWREEPYFSQIKQWAIDYVPRQVQVAVYIKDRVIVVLPDKETDLGTLARSDQIMVARSQDGSWRAFVQRAEESPAETTGTRPRPDGLSVGSADKTS